MDIDRFSTAVRFGGGSEMLINGDEGSVWPLLEVGLVWVHLVTFS